MAVFSNFGILTPEVEPALVGSLTEGTLLKDLTFMGNLDGVAGEFVWINGDQKLHAGINRCYYRFTPDDAVNFESVERGYIDLSVGVAPDGGNGSGMQDWWWIALVGVTALSIILAICAIVAASKKKSGAGDNDGFYDDVTESDLQ